MHDYAGCLHVHSTYSDGDATVPEILDAARDVGLHFVVLTDHDTTQAHHDGLEGWHDGVLLAVGSEIHAGQHHCMALDLQHLDHTPRDTEAQLQHIRAQGGLAFVVHPHPCHKPIFKLWVPGWTDWHLDTFHGIEIWPYLHDWIADLHLRNFLPHCLSPDDWITGPEPDILKQWDIIGLRRRCVGIGALDNHAKRIPTRRLTLFELLPHRYAFRTVRTHILSPHPFTGDPTADLAALYAHLAAGHSYVSYDLHADPTGFRFHATRNAHTIGMGDETPAGEPIEFHVATPERATIRLLCNGQPIAATTDYTLVTRAIDPGVYRIEAHLDGRPWIFSNPIYVR